MTEPIQPDIIQNIPVRLSALLIVTVSGSADTQKIIVACGKAIMAALEAQPFVSSIEAINVAEVNLKMASERTQ